MTQTMTVGFFQYRCALACVYLGRVKRVTRVQHGCACCCLYGPYIEMVLLRLLLWLEVALLLIPFVPAARGEPGRQDDFNEHCPPWRLFREACRDLNGEQEYGVTCSCDAECTLPRGNCTMPDPRPPVLSPQLNGKYEQGKLVTDQRLCCRNPFTCKQECTPNQLHLACPPPPWEGPALPLGKCPRAVGDDGQCPDPYLCCLDYASCRYYCHTPPTDREDAWGGGPDNGAILEAWQGNGADPPACRPFTALLALAMTTLSIAAYRDY